MELKLGMPNRLLISRVTFNRTTMELKQPGSGHTECLCHSFNRTTMELKRHRISTKAYRTACLLIEPLWNWNWISAIVYCFVTGLLIEPLWNWNVKFLSNSKWWYGLLIEPLWNWNLSTPLCDCIDTPLLIEPLWNWNPRQTRQTACHHTNF